MCGRFALSITAAQFARVYGILPPEGYRPRWNVTPDSPVVAVRAGPDGGRQAVLLRWGMLGPWMREADDPGRQINARVETAAEKALFRDAFRRFRCLIPVDGFYDWQKRGKGPSRPFFVRRRDAAPMALAGLWRPLRLGSGELLETCAILTMDASPNLRPIHPRMPVILRPELMEAWLDPELHDPGLLRDLLDPVPDEEIEAYEVGRGVNNPRNDGAALILPLADQDQDPTPTPSQPTLL